MATKEEVIGDTPFNGGYDGGYGDPVEKDTASDEDLSAHTLAQDNPWEVGFQLAGAVDNGFVVGYPLFVMAFLGWVAGCMCFIGGWCVTLYANVLLANLAVIDGKRYFRFRDIASIKWGAIGWWITIVGQWLNIIFGNIGLIILASQAVELIYLQYYPKGTGDGGIYLWQWCIYVGIWLILQSLFIPDLHYLRYLAIIAGACSCIFCFIAIGISINDGSSNNRDLPNGPVRYDTDFGLDTPTKIFNIMGAISTIAFSYTTVIMPEIQATVREPVVRNFYKSLIVSYCGGAPIFLLMSFLGFWAYGSNYLYPNILQNLSGPKGVLTLAYGALWLQSVISFQIYTAPIYETADTAFYRPGGAFAPINILIRLAYRIPFVSFTTFFAALLPFFGDFVVLIGALTVLPLNYVATFLLYSQLKPVSAGYKTFLWIMAFIFAIITVTSTVAAVRYIVVDSIHYSTFANNF